MSLIAHSFTIQENTMKGLQKLCGVVMLVLAINLFVSAGDIHTPKTEPTPTPSAPMEGEIDTGTVDPTVEITLSLLQSILEIF